MPVPHLLMTGLALGESPRWHEGRLWLSDWGAHEVLAADLAGNREIVTHISTVPFSIDWLPDGRLQIVTASTLLCQTTGGSFLPRADLASLSHRPWNEIVVDGRGNTYLNNIGFDFPGGQFAPGTIALVTPTGEVRQVAEGVAFPNGMAVTPDNATLIVAESYGSRLTAFDIAADGSLSNRHTWADLNGDHPDGICLDAEGAIWYADVGAKHCVRVREGGEVLRTIELDRGCFACMLGGSDRHTLFMVAAEFPNALSGTVRTGQILSVEAPAPHAGWP